MLATGSGADVQAKPVPTLGAASTAGAVSAPVSDLVPGAAMVGRGTYSYLFWDLYTATLYAPDGRFRRDAPFALELRYLTDLRGAKIAAVSRDEIARQQRIEPDRLAAWEAQMAKLFPDVTPGSVLTGVRMPDGSTRFYAGTQDLGGVDDPDFGVAFFDIWLGDATRDRGLRQQLLGSPSSDGTTP